MEIIRMWVMKQRDSRIRWTSSLLVNKRLTLFCVREQFSAWSQAKEPAISI